MLTYGPRGLQAAVDLLHRERRGGGDIWGANGTATRILGPQVSLTTLIWIPVLVGWVSLVPLGPLRYCCWLQEDIHLILAPILTLYELPPILLCVVCRPFWNCSLLHDNCRHFVPCIHHVLYVQPRGLLEASVYCTVRIVLGFVLQIELLFCLLYCFDITILLNPAVLSAVLWSVTFWYGSGSGSCSFCQWPSRC